MIRNTTKFVHASSACRRSPARIDIVLSATFLFVFRPLNTAAPSHPLSRLSFLCLCLCRPRHAREFNSVLENLPWQSIRPTRVESEVAPSCSLRNPMFSSPLLLYFVYWERYEILRCGFDISWF